MTQTTADTVTDPASAARWDADIELPDRRRNMDVTLVHRLEAGLMATLFQFSKALGVDRASAFLGGTLRRIGPLLGPAHQRGRANLELVYPDNSPEQNEAILRDVWENLGRTVAEYAHLEKFVPFTDDTRLEIADLEKIEALKATGKPAIFVSCHMANWELMTIAMYRAGFKTAIIYRAANNPIVDAKIIELRAAVMSRYLIPKNKRGSRRLVRALSDGLSLCLLADQKLNDGIEVPFMGHPAMTAPAAARMALKFGVPVVPAEIVRHPGEARFTFRLHDPIRFEETGNINNDTELLTARINEELAAIIDAYPGQWLWLHRRWPKDVVSG